MRPRDDHRPRAAFGRYEQFGARDRKRRETGKCEGRKTRVERLAKTNEKAAAKLKKQLEETKAMVEG
jgi:hypothetical protein